MSMTDAAIEYQSRGWCVVPLVGKRPLVADWPELSQDVVLGMLKKPDAPKNLGVITGKRSNLVVLDIDPKKGGDETLDALEFIYGTIKAPTVRTGSGGRHFYFRYPPHTRVPSSVDRVGPGIDVRADGGQCVAPPSRHPETGNLYLWEVSGEPVSIPPWLLKLVVADSEIKARPVSEWSQLVHNGCKSGGRNNAIASLSGLMLRSLPQEVVAGLLCAWNEARCEPPLTEEEVLAVVNSIARKEYGK